MFPEQFLNEAAKTIEKRLQNILKKALCVKVNLVFEGDFILPGKFDDNGIEVSDRKSFATRNIQLFKGVPVMPSLLELIQRILTKVYQKKESDNKILNKYFFSLKTSS